MSHNKVDPERWARPSSPPREPDERHLRQHGRPSQLYGPHGNETQRPVSSIPTFSSYKTAGDQHREREFGDDPYGEDIRREKKHKRGRHRQKEEGRGDESQERGFSQLRERRQETVVFSIAGASEQSKEGEWRVDEKNEVDDTQHRDGGGVKEYNTLPVSGLGSVGRNGNEHGRDAREGTSRDEVQDTTDKENGLSGSRDERACGQQYHESGSEEYNIRYGRVGNHSSPFQIPAGGSGNLQPTDAYGEVKFTNNGNVAKYTRLHADTDAHTIITKIIVGWQMYYPSLIISVSGGNRKYQMPPQHRDILYRGLTNAAATADAWLLSEGFYTGVKAEVGKAVQQYEIGSGGNKKLVAIGLPAWGCVAGRDKLVQEGGRVDYESQKSEIKNQICLDCNHTHFLMPDDGTPKYKAYIPLLGHLEQAFGDQGVAVVAVLLEGGYMALTNVHSSMEKGFPLVIVKNSGRIANVLVDTCNYIGENPDRSKEDIMAWIQVKVNGLNFKDDTNNNSPGRVYDCAVRWRDRIVLYSTLSENGQPQEFDQTLFSALMTVRQKDPDYHLTLALAWNDVHRARQINIDQIDVDKVKNLLEKAVVEDKTQFVRLLLQNGVDLRSFLYYSRFKKLCDEVPFNLFFVRFRGCIGGFIVMIPELCLVPRVQVKSAWDLVAFK